MLGYFKHFNWFRIKTIGLLIGGIVLCQGCLSVTFGEKDAILTIDRNQIDVLSDLLSGDTVTDSVTLSRPLYAIWLQNSDKQAHIREILKSSILE